MKARSCRAAAPGDLAESRLGRHLLLVPLNLLDEILRLPAAERLRLLEEVWDSVAVTPDVVPVPAWHKAELDARLDHPAPEPSLIWEQVQERLAGLGG